VSVNLNSYQLLKAQATLERFKLGRATYVLGRRAGRLKMAFRGTQHMAGAANTLRTHPGEIRALVDEKVRASTQTAVNRVLGRQVKRYRKGRG
jgi:hypothetical protein